MPAVTKNPSNTSTTIQIQVHGIANNGSAVGKVIGPEGDSQIGITAFVRDAAPTEIVEGSVTKTHKRHLEADFISIVTPSPHRVSPRCSHFGTCGGCDLQYMTYEAQLEAKNAMIAGMFRTLALEDNILQPIIASPEYGYRRRLTLHVEGGVIGEIEERVGGRVGLYQRKSKTILPLSECPISVPAIEDFLKSGPTFPMLEAPAELLLEAGENGLFGTIRVTPLPSYKSLYARMNEYFVGGQVYVGNRPLQAYGEEWIVWPEGRALPGGFSQANTAINDAMRLHVGQIARESGAKTAYDLYSGAGNFALLLAEQGLSVTVVEDDPVLIASGRGEAERKGLSVAFRMQTVEAFLAPASNKRNTGQKTERPPDLIIADPPRSGLENNIELLPISPYMVLISCDTASGVRDIKSLMTQGWQVRHIQPFDMFPQTTHVELLTYLTRE